MKIQYIFDDENIPIEVHVKKNGKRAVYDRRTGKYLTKFENQHILPNKHNHEFRYWQESGGKYLLLEGSNHQMLFIDYELKLHYKGRGRLMWGSGRPNSKYIIRDDDRTGEYFVRISDGKKFLEGLCNTIYPSTNFPENPYFKGTPLKQAGNRRDYGEAIFHFPSGERLTQFHTNISSSGIGVLSDKDSHFYYTKDRDGISIMEKWDKVIISGLNRTEITKIIGDREYDKDLNEYTMIRNLFDDEI